jgi:probable HAF family extracellular repeat protein
MRRRLPLAFALSCAAAPAFAVSFSLTDLGDLPGGSDFSLAFGINEAGQVAGYSGAATGTRAFRWKSGTMTDLGDLPGGMDDSLALGINDAGQVVGYSGTTNGAFDVFRAFLWDNGNITDLGELPGGIGFSQATGINDSGQVVGISQVASTGQRAFL